MPNRFAVYPLFTPCVRVSLPIGCYCGNYAITLSDEATDKEYLSASEAFNALLPDLISRIKDSYVNALIAKGVGLNKGTAIGNAYIAKYGKDLYNFTKGNILVIDRAGTLMFRDIDKDKAIATSIIEKFAEPSTVIGDLEEAVKQFLAKLEKKPSGKESEKQIVTADGLSAFREVLANARALICSRGRHSGEILAKMLNIPCISSCVGATDQIVNGQLIVIDAEWGNVYDASVLRSLS